MCVWCVKWCVCVCVLSGVCVCGVLSGVCVLSGVYMLSGVCVCVCVCVCVSVSVCVCSLTRGIVRSTTTLNLAAGYTEFQAKLSTEQLQQISLKQESLTALASWQMGFSISAITVPH